MKVFPAIKCQMGRWQFFSVKMSMRELSQTVKLAADILYDHPTLDNAIQRALNTSRVKRDLVTYLRHQPDRFFSSVVVAALDGEPNWYPVAIENVPQLDLFRDDSRFRDAFGVLKFDGTENYYALDGQHRLNAIQTLINEGAQNPLPAGFLDEDISVLIVVPNDAEETQEFLVRYRRLFGNLNRYAKATTPTTNIIMDEDDAFAIVTRRLIATHAFFRSGDPQRSDEDRVKTIGGKNLKDGDPYFTSLETLYEMNKKLLSSSRRSSNGWCGTKEKKADQFARFRPTEHDLDSLFEELNIYWDGILNELPILWEDPSKMRAHGADDDDRQDCVLFWPIVQELLADVSRFLLDRQDNPEEPTDATVKSALSGLGDLVWDAHNVPWRHLLLVPEGTYWRIRSEDRKKVVSIARQILLWQMGRERPNIADLRQQWESHLMPAFDERKKTDSLWAAIEKSSCQ